MTSFREMRYNCSIPLKVHVNNAPRDVVLTGFSQTGVRVTSPEGWRVGDDILLPLRRPALRGTVVRTEKEAAGVQLLIRLSGAEIMSLRKTEGCRPIPLREMRH